MRCRMAVCRAEEAGRFAVTAGLAGQSGEAFQDVGDEQVRLEFGGTRERVVGVALGLFWLTLRDRHPGARRQRVRQERAGRCRHGVVGPAAGRDQIPARQRGLRALRRAAPPPSAGRTLRCCRPASVASCAVAASPAARAAIRQRPVGDARVKPAKLGGGLDGRVGGGPGRSRVTLVRQRDALAREAIRPQQISS